MEGGETVVVVLLSPPCPEVSTRMVSEYKTKLQISESENSRLEGTVSCRVVGGREGGWRGRVGGDCVTG